MTYYSGFYVTFYVIIENTYMCISFRDVKNMLNCCPGSHINLNRWATVSTNSDAINIFHNTVYSYNILLSLQLLDTVYCHC